MFERPVEVDEAYIGGKLSNRRRGARLLGRGSVGKTPVAGIKDRATNRI